MRSYPVFVPILPMFDLVVSFDSVAVAAAVVSVVAVVAAAVDCQLPMT